MNDGRLFPLVLLLLSICLSAVQSQGLMGGFKGHHHRGSGAVELLLATGILAKLLNHRAKHGPSIAGRHIMHALLGGARYPPRYGAQGRFPIDLAGAHPSLLQDDLIESHASMASMALPFPEELMLNQESALLAALPSGKSPLLMGHGMPMISDGQLLAEAQISQQLIAARRARKLLEARKLLATQEAKNMLAVQREAAHLLAAQEAAQTATLLSPSRQIFTAAVPPHRMSSQINSGNQQQQQDMMNSMMDSERRIALARSDHSHVVTLPQGLSQQETEQILTQLQHSV